MQSILILLIESDLVYLVFQVSDFYALLMRACKILGFSPFRQTAYLAILMVYNPVKLEEYFFIAVYLSLCVSVGQTDYVNHPIFIYYCRRCIRVW